MDRQDTRPGNATVLTVPVPIEVERRLRERAAREGQAIEQYVLYLIEQDVAGGVLAGTTLSDDEFGHLLDELSAGPGSTPLPADFSRADVYADHD